ncbi:hypothetical protein SE_0207 [Staphylococcus epidermidis ATCC 12228]|uniref:Uncharacterized protein n=1 Tax=Staphylococcus epidermidis (strain ATCC 12228 / FDA PCI 1200) TaxID=176280 RepID=A0A0H2VH19_STAES|nr:hypothetical protein SE_0207 [Staphylococcus epidermidis ATCC 12228]
MIIGIDIQKIDMATCNALRNTCSNIVRRGTPLAFKYKT